MIERASVVLPQPDSPANARISPRPIERSTPSTARAGDASFLLNKPVREANLTWRSCTSKSAPPSTDRSDVVGVCATSLMSSLRSRPPVPVRRGCTTRGDRARTPPARDRSRCIAARLAGTAGGTCTRSGSSRGSGGSPSSPTGDWRSSTSPIVGKEPARACEYGCRGSAKTDAAGPVSTMRPAYITATRSLTWASTDRSWVMNRIDSPMSRCRSASSCNTCACTMTSSAVVGSSAITSFGSHASAIAIITRCFWPPENSWGKSSARRDGSPTRSSSSAVRRSASFRSAMPWVTIASTI